MSSAPTPDSRLATEVADFVRQAVTLPQEQRPSFPESALWTSVAKTGTALWLDTGDIDAARALWTREFQALTTNNTLLNKEVQKGIYDDLAPDTAALIRNAQPDIADQDLVAEIAFVLNAVHGLKLVRTFDADVSVELHTAIANDVEASYRYGKRFAAICPDRFIVKVPLTPAGMLAARKLGRDGIRLNFTLGFSARQNLMIASVAQPTYVNVFMGRINAFLADNKLGDGVNAGEKATLASQRALRSLRTEGIDVRQIGASMRGGQQALDLLGLDVFTMPTGAAKEFLDLDPGPDAIQDKTANDPAVAFADGVDADTDRLDVFWSVPERFAEAMAALRQQDLDSMAPETLLEFLRGHGVSDIFPQFDASEQQRLTEEGKIPVYASWCDRVRAGEASWDGTLTAAALSSFAQDQQALDDRIAGLI
jgi:transaldolase